MSITLKQAMATAKSRNKKAAAPANFFISSEKKVLAKKIESEDFNDSTHLINHLLTDIGNDQLNYMKNEFLRHEDCKMDLEQFEDVIRQTLTLIPGGGHGIDSQLIAGLFAQLDTDCDGQVTWNDFSSGVIDTFSKGKKLINLYKTEPFVPDTTFEFEAERLFYIKGIRKFLVCGKGKSFSICNPADGANMRNVIGHTSPVLYALFIPVANRVLTSSADRTIAVWDTFNFSKIKQFSTESPALCMAYHAPSQTLFSGHTDGKIRLWEATMSSLSYASSAVREKIMAFEGHTDWVMDLVIIEELGLLVSCSIDRSVRMWDMKTGEIKSGTDRAAHTKGVLSLAYSSQYRFLFSAGFSREILVWNPFTHSVIHRIRGHEKPLLGVYAFDDSPELVSVDSSGKVMIWDTRSFSCVQSLGGPASKDYSGPVSGMCVDFDRKQVITIGASLNLWRCEDISEAGVIARPITAIAYSSTFQVIVLATGPELFVHKASTGAVQAHFHNMTDCDISTVTLAENGRDLYVGNLEGHIRLLSLINGFISQDFHAIPDEIRNIFLVKNFNPKEELKINSAIATEIFMASHGMTSTGLSAAQHALMVSQSSGAALPGAEKAPQIPDTDNEEKFSGSSIMNDEVIETKILLVTTTAGHVLIVDYSKPGHEFIFARIDWYSEARKQGIKLPVEDALYVYSNDTHTLAVCIGQHVLMWNIESGSVKARIRTDHPVTSCIFVEALNCFITGHSNGVLLVWTLPSLFLISSFVSKKTANHAIRRIALCQTGLQLIISGDVYIEAIELVRISERFCEDYALMSYNPVPGTSLYRERFELDGETIEGGFNAITFAFDVRTGRKVALKFVKDVREFRQEVKCLSSVKSKFVCQHYDSHESESPSETSCVVLEAGEQSLHDIIYSARYRSHETPWIVECLARALADLHKAGFISSDVKPRNVLRFGNTWKIIDLDNSRQPGENLPLKYTPSSCAPEMAKLFKGIEKSIIATPSFDMWGFGATIYELCARHPVFAGKEEKEIMNMLSDPEVPMIIPLYNIKEPELRTLVENCLQRNPQDRWTADQVLDYLGKIGWIAPPEDHPEEFKPFPKIIPGKGFKPIEFDYDDYLLGSVRAHKNPMTCLTVSTVPSAIFTADFQKDPSARATVAIHNLKGELLATLPKPASLPSSPSLQPSTLPSHLQPPTATSNNNGGFSNLQPISTAGGGGGSSSVLSTSPLVPPSSAFPSPFPLDGGSSDFASFLSGNEQMGGSVKFAPRRSKAQ